MNMRLQTQLIVLIGAILSVTLLIGYLILTFYTTTYVRDQMGKKVEAVAAAVARAPGMGELLEDAHGREQIQQYAEEVRAHSGVNFIVVFDRKGYRLSHPDAEKIGRHIEGNDEQAVFQGYSYLSYAKGSLGESLRAFCPVYSSRGDVVGGVVVGIMLGSVNQVIVQRKDHIIYALLVVFSLGIFAAVIAARSIRQSLLGMEPAAIARITKERDAVIQSVREGILAVNHEGRITLLNEEAQHIFQMAGMRGPWLGELVEEKIPGSRMREILLSGQAELNQEQTLNGVNILTNRLPLIVNGQIIGALATFRNLAEVRSLAEELTGVKKYVEALRIQTHEFLNKMHVINGLVMSRQYEELLKYVERILAADTKESGMINSHVKDPVVAAFLQSKWSRSKELGIRLYLQERTEIPCLIDKEWINNLVTLVGNLIDNAIEAVQHCEQREVELGIWVQGSVWHIEVRDTGTGIAEAEREDIFRKGYSSKGENRGFGLFLVARILLKYAGHVQILPNHPCGTWFCIELTAEKKGGC